VASLGIASLLLPGGRTAHSRFGIPLDINESSTCSIPKNGQLADLIRQTSLLIWDEVPMQNKYCFEAVHRTLADIRDDPSLFGGIPTVLGGDFAQILPVVPRGSREATVQACIQRSFIWPQLKVLFLTENMRIRTADEHNRAFLEWTQRLSYDPEYYGLIELPPFVARFEHFLDLIERVYPRALLAESGTVPDFFRTRSILASRNSSVREINHILIDRLPGETTEYLSEDKADLPEDGGEGGLPVEVLHSFEVNGLPSSRLRLKEGTPIMLLRNINPDVGLCNRTRLVVTRLGQNYIEARVIAGKASGEIHFIPRIKLSSDEKDLGFILTRRQFPV